MARKRWAEPGDLKRCITSLLHRLFVQIGRILKIYGLTLITEDVVEAARSTLVIDVT